MPSQKKTAQQGAPKVLPPHQGQSKSARKRARRRAAAMQLQVAHPAPAVHRVMNQHKTVGAALARQIALPSEGTPIRVPTRGFPSVSIARFTDSFAIKSAGIADGVVSQGTLRFLHFGEPGRLITYGPVGTSISQDTVIGTFFFQNGVAGPKGSGTCKIGSGTLQADTTYTGRFNPIGMNGANGHPQPGPTGSNGEIPLGNDNLGRVWFRANSSHYLRLITLTGSEEFVPAGTLTVTLYSWAGPNEPPVQKGTYKQGTEAKFDIKPFVGEGYYTFDYSLSTSAAYSEPAMISFEPVLMSNIANPQFHIDLPMSSLIDAGVAARCRRTACSLLVSNTSAALSREGSIIAARQPNSNDESFTTQGLTLLKDKFTGPAEKGLYTYLDFEETDETFRDYASNLMTFPVFHMDRAAMVGHVQVFNPNFGSQPNSYLVTVTTIVEFQSTNALYSRAVSFGLTEMLDDARRISNATTYFYENPMHLSDIWGYIKKAFNLARTSALPIGLAASALFPEAAGPIMGVAHALQA